MTAAAKNSFGATLKLADVGGSVAAVAELSSITPPARTRDTIDVTTHDGASQAMEFIGSGVYDTGEIQVAGNYIAGSTGDDLFGGKLAANTNQDFEIVVKAASGTETMSGECIITEFSIGELTVDGKQEFTATLKVTGAITQAPTV